MKTLARLLTVTLLLLCSAQITHAVTPERIDAEFAEVLSGLTASKIKARTAAVMKLTESNDERTVKVMNALLASKLYFRKSDKWVAIFENIDGETYAEGVITGQRLLVSDQKAWKKSIIGNRQRTQLRGALASIQLTNPATDIRLKAVKQLLAQLDESLYPASKKQLAVESDPAIKSLLEITVATLGLRAGEGNKLNQIQTVKDSLHPSVRQVLEAVADNDPAEDIRLAAKSALKDINYRLEWYGKADVLFFGLSMGSVLVLAAIGLAITFGVMGVINMAHGELIMLGAYTTYVVQLWLPNLIDYSVLIAIPLAFLVSGAVGILIERGIIRFLYGRPLETLLATFGVSLILQQVVRSIFSPLNKAVEAPSWMSGVWQINDALSLTLNRLYIIIFAFLVFGLLYIILNRTTLGLKVRAVSQNRAMARCMGVKANWVDAMTFGLGSGVAGVAGVALSQLTNVGPNLGQAYIIDSFMVVVFGGVGNLWGTLVAGLSLGVGNKLLEPWAGAVLAKIIVLIAIILFIQRRPRGLFPQKGRAVDH